MSLRGRRPRRRPSGSAAQPAFIPRRLAEVVQENTPLRLLACLDGIADGVVISDLQGNLLYWNPAALRLHGYRSIEEVRQHLSRFQSTFQLFYPSGQIVPFDQWPIPKLIRGEPVAGYELLLKRVDTQQSWVLQYFGAITASQGTQQVVLTIQDLTEHRRIERHLAAIVQNSDDAIVGKSLDGTITSWNRAAEKMFGYPESLAIGRNITMLLPPERLDEEYEILRRLRQGQAIEHFESQRVTQDGRQIAVSLTISPIRDSGGRVVGASKIARDITSRQAAERQLRTSYALLQTLVEGISDPVYVKDTTGKYLLGNSALGQVIGRPVAEVVGCRDEQILSVEQSVRVRNSDQQIMAEGRPRTFEEAVSSQGQVHHYLTTKAPYYDADGRVAGVLGISRDVTSLKVAEQAVQRSEQHLRGMLDGLLVYVAVLQPGAKLTGMNRALRQALESHGIDADQIEGKPLFESAMAGTSPQVQEQLRRAIAQASMGQAVRLDAVPLFDNPAIVLDLMLSPMRGEDERQKHLIVSAVDVTQREAAARQARERQTALAHLERLRTMGQMAAGLAHELNQPLGAIANYASASRRLLASGRSTEASLASTLEEIQAEAARAGAIIQRLRTFVKKQQPQGSAVPIHEVIDESLQLLNYNLRQAGVKVERRFAEALPPVLVDPVQIVQILINLIGNAIDAMTDTPADQRRLVIHTEAADAHVRVSVADQGCGVSPAAMTQIFDAFFTTKPHGMGIGLALCRTIVEDHGGHLSAEPNSSGGMTFTFTLLPAA